MSKWHFNKSLIEEAINTGQSFLLSPNLSKQDRLEITSDIKRFKLFLDGNFDNYIRRRRQNMPYLKNNIISGMKNLEKILSPRLRRWLIDLAQDQIFTIDSETPIFTMSLDEAAKTTLKNYKMNASAMYNFAKTILEPKQGIIQEAVLNTSSYCFYSDILQLPFIVVDPLDDAGCLNHELEHGIEYLMGTRPHFFYSEFGPIFFELLFCDESYKKYGKSSLAMHITRIKETEDYLNVLAVYFCAMKIFSLRNYDVSEQFFLETFEYFSNVENDNLIDFLNDEFVNSQIIESITYVLSFLKAIQVRELANNGGNQSGASFNDIVFSKKFKFKIPDSNYQLYEKYIEEIKQKMR